MNKNKYIKIEDQKDNNNEFGNEKVIKNQSIKRYIIEKLKKMINI